MDQRSFKAVVQVEEERGFYEKVNFFSSFNEQVFKGHLKVKKAFFLLVKGSFRHL